MGNTGIAITMKLIKLCDFPGYFPHNKTCVLVKRSKSRTQALRQSWKFWFWHYIGFNVKASFPLTQRLWIWCKIKNPPFYVLDLVCLTSLCRSCRINHFLSHSYVYSMLGKVGKAFTFIKSQGIIFAQHSWKYFSIFFRNLVNINSFQISSSFF